MISVKQAAKKLKVSDRRVRVLCEEGRIPGAEKVGGAVWILPDSPRVLAKERRRPGSLKMVEK